MYKGGGPNISSLTAKWSKVIQYDGLFYDIAAQVGGN